MPALRRATALLGALCAVLAHTAAAARLLTPGQICAQAGSRRKALSSTKFVSCLNGTPWEVLDCPLAWDGRQLRFSEGLQTCVPTGMLVPPTQPPPNPPAQTSIYLYVWSGVDNPGPQCRDAVVTLDATPESATFGSILSVSPIPDWGTEPHHVGLVASGTVLAVGGIQAYLRAAPDVNLFDVTTPDQPRWLTSVDPPLSAVTDSFSGQADGGFWVSQMGDANGGTPGRMARIGPGPEWSVVGEYPQSPPPGFNPHGFAIWNNKMVTADNLEMKSTITSKQLPSRFRGSARPVFRHTLRVWDLPAFTPAGEFETAPEDSLGFMTVQFIGSTGVAVSGGGKGVLYGLNVSAPNPGATAKPVHYVAGDVTGSCVFAPLAFSSGQRFVVTVLGLSLVQLVDTSNPWRWKTIQEVYLPKGTYPHAVTAARNGALLAVSTYYIDHHYRGQPIGTIRDAGSREVFFFDVLDGGNRIQFNRRRPVVDFKQEVGAFLGTRKCGAYRPHGMAFKTVTRP